MYEAVRSTRHGLYISIRMKELCWTAAATYEKLRQRKKIRETNEMINERRDKIHDDIVCWFHFSISRSIRWAPHPDATKRKKKLKIDSIYIDGIESCCELFFAPLSDRAFVHLNVASGSLIHFVTKKNEEAIEWVSLRKISEFFVSKRLVAKSLNWQKNVNLLSTGHVLRSIVGRVSIRETIL